MSKERLRRLAELERRLLRPKFVAVDYAAIARAARSLLDWFEVNRKAVQSGRASALPRDPLPPESKWSPAKLAAHDMLDRIAQSQAGRVDAERSERRAAKKARRAARRAAETASRGAIEAGGEPAQHNGLLSEPAVSQRRRPRMELT